MTEHDFLTRFVFAIAPVRGVHCALRDVLHEVTHRYSYPPEVANLLGESLVAVSLLAAMIKFEGRVSLQLQGGQNVPLLLAQTDHLRRVRGVAQWQTDVSGMRFDELVAGAVMAVNIEPINERPYQGIVPLDGKNLAECLEMYFAQSEQLATRFWIASDAAAAGGLMLQRLPQTTESENLVWDELTLLADTVQDEELQTLPTEMLARRLFAEHDVQILPSESVQFHCSCSYEKALASIFVMSNADIRDLLQDSGQISTECEFCRQRYVFTEDEIFEEMAQRGQIDDRLQ